MRKLQHSASISKRPQLQACYVYSANSWGATLVESTQLPACPAGGIMLVADPNVPLSVIRSAVTGLTTDLLTDNLELNGLGSSSLRSAA